jgi:hypothetical protein
MGYMEMSGNKRTISFAPSGAYYAKNSLGLDSVIEIPGIQTANSFIRDVVVSAIERKREQDKIQAGPYDEVIKRINSIVSAAGNVAAINEALGKVSTLNHIWDSRIYAWSKLSAAAEALGASWDKAAKRFAGSAAPPVTAVPPPEPPPAKEAVPPPEPPAKEAPPPLAGANGNTSGAKPDVPASRPNGNTGSRKTTPEPDTPPVPAMDEEDEEEEPEDYEEEEPPEEYDGPEINDEDIPFWDDDKSPAAPPPPAKEPAAALDDRDNHEPPWEDLGNRPAEAGRSVRLGLSEGFDRFIRKKKTAGAMAYEEDIF